MGEFCLAWLPAVVLPKAHEVLEQAIIGDVDLISDLQARR